MYLRLLEETLPVPLILASFSESEESQVTPFDGRRDELASLLEVMASSLLNQGHTRDEVIAKLASMEPFNHHVEFLEATLEEVLRSMVK
jgi:hypothetical protein